MVNTDDGEAPKRAWCFDDANFAADRKTKPIFYSKYLNVSAMNFANRLGRHTAASSHLLIIPDKAVNSAVQAHLSRSGSSRPFPRGALSYIMHMQYHVQGAATYQTLCHCAAYDYCRMNNA